MTPTPTAPVAAQVAPGPFRVPRHFRRPELPAAGVEAVQEPGRIGAEKDRLNRCRVCPDPAGATTPPSPPPSTTPPAPPAAPVPAGDDATDSA